MLTTILRTLPRSEVRKTVINDVILRPTSHLQFYRAILSHSFIARRNRKCDMPCRTISQQSQTPFPIRAALYSVQHCRENAVNADWPILVYATKVVVCDTHLQFCRAIKLRDKIAGVTSVLHTSKVITWLGFFSGVYVSLFFSTRYLKNRCP